VWIDKSCWVTYNIVVEIVPLPVSYKADLVALVPTKALMISTKHNCKWSLPDHGAWDAGFYTF
jgi:hypothetical protein